MAWTPLDSLKWLTFAAVGTSILSGVCLIFRIIWPHIVSTDLIITFCTTAGALWGGVTTVLTRIGKLNSNSKENKNA